MKRKILKPWSRGEEEAIIRAMGTLTNDMTQEQAFENLAKRLNRSVDAIKQRWYTNIKPNLPAIIKNDLTVHLDYARKTYTVGTVVESLKDKGIKFRILNDNFKVNDETIKVRACPQGTFYANAGLYTIYSKEKGWAKIAKPEENTLVKPEVKKSKEEELLEYAKKNYPVGTVVKSCMSGDLFKLIGNITLNYGDIFATGINRNGPNIKSTCCLYSKTFNQWSIKINDNINFPEKESEQSVEVKEKGIFLNVSKLEKLSINFLKEIASAKVETASKKELIDIIVD